MSTDETSLEDGCPCKHESSKLTFSKMFQNDNGDFGGEIRTILLDCECGDTIFIYSYRGNISKQYYQPNSVLCHHVKGHESIKLKQQEIW